MMMVLSNLFVDFFFGINMFFMFLFINFLYNINLIIILLNYGFLVSSLLYKFFID